MTVITISRHYGSGGDEVAARVCELLEYRYFDKRLMAQLASEMGLAPTEVVDFSEDNYEIRGFLDRWRGPRVVAQIETWQKDETGTVTRAVEKLDEADSINLVQGTIQAAYKYGNIVIVGRGGQAILKDKPGVLHVRIQAPLDARVLRLHQRENFSLGWAQDVAIKHDRAAADYLKRFYNIDWADPLLYHLMINTGRWSIEAAAQLITKAVSYLPPEEASA